VEIAATVVTPGYSFGGLTLNLTVARPDLEMIRLWLFRRLRLKRASGESWKAMVITMPIAIKPTINQTNKSPRMIHCF
jgi:hypothetical protein